MMCAHPQNPATVNGVGAGFNNQFNVTESLSSTDNNLVEKQMNCIRFLLNQGYTLHVHVMGICQMGRYYYDDDSGPEMLVERIVNSKSEYYSFFKDIAEMMSQQECADACSQHLMYYMNRYFTVLVMERDNELLSMNLPFCNQYYDAVSSMRFD